MTLVCQNYVVDSFRMWDRGLKGYNSADKTTVLVHWMLWCQAVHMLCYKVWGSDFLTVQYMHWPVMGIFVLPTCGSFPATTIFGTYGSNKILILATQGSGWYIIMYSKNRWQGCGSWHFSAPLYGLQSTMDWKLLCFYYLLHGAGFFLRS